MQHTSDISQNKALLWLMAIACGLCAGANYYCQPLIHSIQADFGVPEAQAALTVTFAQVSYALGLLFIVPLGDVVNKTKFIPLLMFLAGIGLLLCGFAINLPMLWIGTVMTGLFSVAAQVLIPLATMAVKPEKIGEVVGFLMSGLLSAFCFPPVWQVYYPIYFTGRSFIYLAPYSCFSPPIYLKVDCLM